MNIDIWNSKYIHNICNRKGLVYSRLPIARRGHIFLGNYCNYRCIFCYNKNLQNEKFYHKERIKQYIDFIFEYGIRDLEFTGGEPSLNNDLVELIYYSKNKGFKNIAFITNGFDNTYYKDYYQNGCNEILFSIHGYDEKSNYLITGFRDSWNRLLSSIDKSLKLGFKLRVNTTICKYNYNKLYLHSEKIKSIFGDNLFAINYLPMNSWDNSILDDDFSIPFYFYTDELSSSIDNFKNVRKAIRYIPYCVIKDIYYKYIYNNLQHIYDPYDWNRELNGRDIDLRLLKYPYGYYSLDSVYNTRLALYVKFKRCLYCKLRYLCDGFQFNSISREEYYLKNNKYYSSCLFNTRMNLEYFTKNINIGNIEY